MDTKSLSPKPNETNSIAELFNLLSKQLTEFDTFIQALIIAGCYLLAYQTYTRVIKRLVDSDKAALVAAYPSTKSLFRIAALSFPILAITLLKIFLEIGKTLGYDVWLIKFATSVAVLLFFYSVIRELVSNQTLARALYWIGLPLLLLHLTDVLPILTASLEKISLTAGNINVTLYGVLRVILFGSVLFFLGRASSTFGKNIIRNQHSLDVTTREVFSKLLEVGLFTIGALLLLNVMGINLTALAVFSGAVGVGIGLGLQSIASNFFAGIIILLDKSLTVGDYVELSDHERGFVREFGMRYVILETYDGKDILIPNEKFISSALTNWTHKDPKQRYRVDFSVAYSTDIRSMVEIIKEAVSEHPQVISGPDIPFEERPDCEIDSFGDNGVNMFVEFWMTGVDDGKNRVGGDLLLIIFETLKAHNISIPFPQREVKLLEPRESNS